jgi:hypothetical protein
MLVGLTPRSSGPTVPHTPHGNAWRRVLGMLMRDDVLDSYGPVESQDVEHGRLDVSDALPGV